MTAAVPPPAYGQHHGVSPTSATGMPTAGPGSSPAAFPVVPPPAYGHHPQQQHHAPYPSSSSATTPTGVTSAPPTGAMGALQQPQRSSQSQARDALLSTVGQRYSDLRKVVELEAEKVRTCVVPCVSCRVPCVVCCVSFLSKTRRSVDSSARPVLLAEAADGRVQGGEGHGVADQTIQPTEGRRTARRGRRHQPAQPQRAHVGSLTAHDTSFILLLTIGCAGSCR